MVALVCKASAPKLKGLPGDFERRYTEALGSPPFGFADSDHEARLITRWSHSLRQLEGERAVCVTASIVFEQVAKKSQRHWHTPADQHITIAFKQVRQPYAQCHREQDQLPDVKCPAASLYRGNNRPSPLHTKFPHSVRHVVLSKPMFLAVLPQVPAYPRSRRERPMLESVVASHCVRRDGLAASSAYAVENTLDDLVGDEAALRGALRPIIVGLVKRAMAEDVMIRLLELTEHGVR